MRMNIQKVVEWYSNLSPDTLGQISTIYHEGAHFKDPFNDVRGHKAIKAIFAHMFATTIDPRFSITRTEQCPDSVWICWDFSFSLKSKQVSFEGSSRITYGEDGRIITHIDYWDGSELLAQLPTIGPAIRWVRKKLATQQEK